MKLTVLGCWAPYPKAGGACSGYLLQSGGNNILIECGNGALSNLLKHVDFRSLQAVVISHLHPDHYLDLFCLRHAIGGAKRLEPRLGAVDVYLPGLPSEPFNQLSQYKDVFNIKVIEQLPRQETSGGPVFETVAGQDPHRVRLLFHKTDHPLLTYALVAEGDGRLFYSADTKWNSSLPGFAAGVDVALCEASVIEEDREYTSVGHLTARQAGKLARQAGAGQLVITHFWPEYDQETLAWEAKSGFGGPVTLAHEGLQLTFGTGSR